MEKHEQVAALVQEIRGLIDARTKAGDQTNRARIERLIDQRRRELAALQ